MEPFHPLMGSMSGMTDEDLHSRLMEVQRNIMMAQSLNAAGATIAQLELIRDNYRVEQSRRLAMAMEKKADSDRKDDYEP